MTVHELRELEGACLWAKGDQAPPEAKTLLHEIERRAVDWNGTEVVCEKPPENRQHKCVEKNAMEIVVSWIEYDKKYGFFLVSNNLYGDGTVTDIKFCPFCGEKLLTLWERITKGVVLPEMPAIDEEFWLGKSEKQNED